MTIRVTAYPNEGHDQYFRCGQKWIRTPVEVQVSRDTKGEYIVTPDELEVLRKDSRLKVEGDAPMLDDGPTAAALRRTANDEQQALIEAQRAANEEASKGRARADDDAKAAASTHASSTKGQRSTRES